MSRPPENEDEYNEWLKEESLRDKEAFGRIGWTPPPSRKVGPEKISFLDEEPSRCGGCESEAPMEKLKVSVEDEEREAWICPCGWAHIDDSDKFAIDIPDPNNLDGESVNLGYFKTRERALAWAKENLGTDDEGKILVISSLPGDD